MQSFSISQRTYRMAGWGSLSWWSLSRGVSAQGGLCLGGLCLRGGVYLTETPQTKTPWAETPLDRDHPDRDPHTPPYGNEWAVRILLECILVLPLCLGDRRQVKNGNRRRSRSPDPKPDRPFSRCHLNEQHGGHSGRLYGH